MNLDVAKLPDDPVQLKQLLIDQDQKYQEKIDYLEQMISLFQKELFGRKSEKLSVDDRKQLSLFQCTHQEYERKPVETITIPAYKRKKRGRKPLCKDIPRVDVIHDLNEEEKICGCGQKMSRIGQDECDKLDYIPAKIRVLHHIRYKYACKHCEGVEDDGPTVKIAAMPLQLLPKSVATAGLLGHIIVSKFADGLPLYRQEKMFDRIGIELPRATMSKWVVDVYKRCEPLVDLLKQDIRGGPLINCDESPLKVLKEPGRKNTSKSYMWVFCGGTSEKPVILYEYHSTRNGQSALEFLKDYKGYLQSDAFAGYNHLSERADIIQLGCWAHARRKFIEVVNAKKKNRSKRKNPRGLAEEALEYIGGLYQVEKLGKAQNLDPSGMYKLRQERSKPLLDEFKSWLIVKEPLTPPKGLLGKAIGYTLGNWNKLVVYISDGILKPDNNAAENAIRPFVVGRKNWLFAGSPKGASASAAFFSIIETAKKNKLEPYSYLSHLFVQLPLAETEDDYKKLLPYNVKLPPANDLTA